MSNKCKIIYNNQGERVGVQEIGSNNPSQTFQDILNDPHTKNFDEALQIYKNLYSVDFTTPQENFEQWKGTNEMVDSSDLQDVRTGQPIVAKVYHGTTNEFYEFDASVKGNIEGHLGKVNYFTSDYGDANENYLAEGADITGRVDRRQDEIESELFDYFDKNKEALNFQQIIDDFNITDSEVEDLYPSGKPEFIQAEEISRFLAEKELKGGTEQVLELYVKLNNPVVLGNGATWFDALEIDEVYLEEATQEIAEEYGITEQEAKDEYDYEIRDRAVEKQGDGNKVVEALERALDDNGYDSSQASDILGDNYYESEVDLQSLENQIRSAELYDNYEGELASSQVIADFFKNLGFDGIILTDVSKRFRNMGLGANTSHVHVFDEYNNQIKLADGSNVTFGETSDIRFSLENTDPTLKYQTEEGNIYNSYAEALRNTNGNEIKIGINTVNGFKEIYSKSTNTNVDSQDGLINHLIKAGILSDKTYSFNGKTHLIPEGRTSAKKTINAEIIKDTFQQKLGVKTAKLQADGSVLIDEDNSRNKVRITNKSGDLVTVDLNAPFSELKKEFEPETIAQIFAGNTLNKAMSGKTITKQEFVPEDKLQEMLMNLLKKFGIKTLSFEDYLKNNKIRKGLPINARALADTANKLIAFKDGIIENDDLVEEVAHLIESSIPQEQKENILRNIHKTKEWGQFYEQYKNLYPTENELRREILGKVIASSIKEQFQARNQNITEDSIINKIKQFFDEFLARIRAYFQDSFQTELDNLTKEIYKNLEEETLTLDLEGVNNIFFSDVNSSVSVDKIVEKTQKAIEIVKDQERLLAKKYKNPANKSAITNIEKSFEFAEKAYKVNGVAQFAKLISSQVNTLLDSANKKEKGKYPLNAEENVVYVNLIKKIKPALSEIEFLLDKKDSQEIAIKEELEKIADSLRQLEAKVVEGREDAILDLAKKAVATHDMTDKERKEYENLVRMALSGSQKDTDIIHAHLGSLLMAKNPLLNLAGNTIERMTLLQNEDFQKNWKKLTSKLQALDWKQKDFEAIIDEETFEIINERDAKKAAKIDALEKEDIKNKVLESLNLVGDFEIEGEPNFEELQLKYPDRQDELNAFESAYKRAWNKNLSERRESFFKKDFIKDKETHPVKINGEKPEITPLALEVEAQFRKERASIRINAGDNLSPSDQARIKEVDRQQREAENPRNTITGELYPGIKEVYDESLERWVVVLNQEEFRTLSIKDQDKVSTIVGLNHLKYKNQDFYKKRKETEEEINGKRDIPQAFLDRLAELQTTEEKLAFIDTNAFISFPDEYYNQFKDGQGLIDRLREAGEEGLIKSIRAQQAIINKGGSFDLVSSLHLYCRLIHVVDLSEPCFGMNQMQRFIAAPNFSQLENSSTIQDTIFIEKYFIIIT